VTKNLGNLSKQISHILNKFVPWFLRPSFGNKRNNVSNLRPQDIKKHESSPCQYLACKRHNGFCSPSQNAKILCILDSDKAWSQPEADGSVENRTLKMESLPQTQVIHSDDKAPTLDKETHLDTARITADRR
jgi:hypothetical protein